MDSEGLNQSKQVAKRAWLKRKTPTVLNSKMINQGSILKNKEGMS